MKLTLRPLMVEDAAAMVDVLADPKLYTFTGGEPPTRPELERRYCVQTRGYSSDGTERWVNEIIEVDGRPVGYVQATVPVAGGPADATLLQRAIRCIYRQRHVRIRRLDRWR